VIHPITRYARLAATSQPPLVIAVRKYGIAIFDKNTRNVIKVHSTNDHSEMVLFDNGQLFASNSNNAQRIYEMSTDGTSLSLKATIYITEGKGLAFDEDFVYFAGQSGDTWVVKVVNRSTYAIERTINIGGKYNYCEDIRRQGNYLLTCSEDNKNREQQRETENMKVVRIYDINTWEFTTFELTSPCEAMDVYANYIFVMDRWSNGGEFLAHQKGDIQIHDMTKILNNEESLVRQIRHRDHKPYCHSIRFNPNTAQVYVGCGWGSMVVHNFVDNM